MDLEVVTVAERRDLEDEAEAAFRDCWPEFMLHDAVPLEFSARIDEYFSEFVIFLLHRGRVVAGGWGVPLRWDGTAARLPEGAREAMVASVHDYEAGHRADAFCFMAATVARQYGRQGLAGDVLSALLEVASKAGLARVVAPVRPILKHRYPQFGMAQYATWTRDDGLSIDPWIRVHQRMGATILKPAPNSVVVSGTVAEWENWTDMRFPVSGAYVVPAALNLLDVDHEHDLAIYREENLWVQHCQ
jgi:GNAT superfamily N-acetyltransferase